MSDVKPDWENFAKAVLTDWPTGDMDGSVLFDLSLQYGMIQEVPGGYNSDAHIDADGICPEEGDPWYVYTFRGEAGPGLYSILGINNYIEDREKACVEWAEVSQSNYQRAKAAEAKLAQAVEALRFYAWENEMRLPSDGPWGAGSTDFGKVARATLAVIKAT